MADLLERLRLIGFTTQSGEGALLESRINDYENLSAARRAVAEVVMEAGVPVLDSRVFSPAHARSRRSRKKHRGAAKTAKLRARPRIA